MTLLLNYWQGVRRLPLKAAACITATVKIKTKGERNDFLLDDRQYIYFSLLPLKAHTLATTRSPTPKLRPGVTSLQFYAQKTARSKVITCCAGVCAGVCARARVSVCAHECLDVFIPSESQSGADETGRRNPTATPRTSSCVPASISSHPRLFRSQATTTQSAAGRNRLVCLSVCRSVRECARCCVDWDKSEKAYSSPGIRRLFETVPVGDFVPRNTSETGPATSTSGPMRWTS